MLASVQANIQVSNLHYTDFYEVGVTPFSVTHHNISHTFISGLLDLYKTHLTLDS